MPIFLPKLRKSNVFTPVCLSVHRGSSLWMETPLDRDPPWTDLGRDTSSTETLDRDPLDRDSPGLTSSGSHQIGWYASYWNAYLFKITCAHFTQLIIAFHISFTWQVKPRQLSTLSLFQLTGMYVIISL